MALRFPARTRSATATAGSGTYTLTEPTSDGWRNLTQAVADGDLANGDQVAYCVVDLTVAGDVVLEIGLGTWDNTAKTLTRDTVHQPNATAVSWGAGTRDVLVIDPVMLAVLTLGDQTVSGVKTFTSVLRAQLAGTPFGADGSTPLIIQNSGTAGAVSRIGIIAGNTGVSELSLGDTDAQYRGRIHYNHATDVLTLYRAAAVGASLDAAGLKDAAGNPYIALPGGGVTAMVFRQAAAPTGWTKSTADNDAALRVVSGTPGASGGSVGVSSGAGTTGSTPISIAQMPAHTHLYVAGASGALAGSGGTLNNPTSSTTTNFESSPTGGGGGHTHTFTLPLKYADCLVATKN
jgi:hypothetical protein